jgi:hypothetical protein
MQSHQEHIETTFFFCFFFFEKKKNSKNSKIPEVPEKQKINKCRSTKPQPHNIQKRWWGIETHAKPSRSH